jgi:large subunit ribosomal protein L24e
MVKCSFCNNEMPKGTGKMYVKASGQIWYFCSSKCEKNLIKLGRIPREEKWVNNNNEKKSDKKRG